MAKRFGESEVPDRGHLVWIDFDPVAGHEQGGRRPALVVSPVSYNRIHGLMLACPITSRIKGYRFEVKVSAASVSGVVLCDHVRNVSWKERRADYIGAVDELTLNEVAARVIALLDPN